MVRWYDSAPIFLATMVVGGSLLLSASAQAEVLTGWTVLLTKISAAALNLLGFSVQRDAQTLSTTAGLYPLSETPADVVRLEPRGRHHV